MREIRNNSSLNVTKGLTQVSEMSQIAQWLSRLRKRLGDKIPAKCDRGAKRLFAGYHYIADENPVRSRLTAGYTSRVHEKDEP